MNNEFLGRSMLKDQVAALNDSRLTPLEKQSANFALNFAMSNSVHELTTRLVEIEQFLQLMDSDDSLMKINEEILPVIKAEEKEISETLATFALIYEEAFDISA